MYGIFTYIYHKFQPNVGKYSIHGAYADEVNASHETGTAILFPSHVTHRVLPVTRGERHSLVLWLKLDAGAGGLSYMDE